MLEHLNSLIKIVTEKGSNFKTLMPPSLSCSETENLVLTSGLKLPQDYLAYWALFGGGFQKREHRYIDLQLFPYMVPLSLDGALYLRSHHARSDILGSDVIKALKKKGELIPIMTNGSDYICLFWSESEQGVVWKLNSFGFPAEYWKSLDDLFKYGVACWQEGVFQFDFEKDEISVDWDRESEIKRTRFKVVEVGGADW